MQQCLVPKIQSFFVAARNYLFDFVVYLLQTCGCNVYFSVASLRKPATHRLRSRKLLVNGVADPTPIGLHRVNFCSGFFCHRHVQILCWIQPFKVIAMIPCFVQGILVLVHILHLRVTALLFIVLFSFFSFLGQDMFFKYTWNNFLHTQVEICIALILASPCENTDSTISEQNATGDHILLKHVCPHSGLCAIYSRFLQRVLICLPILFQLFLKCHLIDRILEAWALNEKRQ